MRGDSPFDPTLTLTANPAERRQMAQRAELERAELRQREIDAQRAPHALPQERIRIWESLHALRLPLAQEHPLVAIIANQTQLSIDDIKDEQGRRASQHEAGASGR